MSGKAKVRRLEASEKVAISVLVVLVLMAVTLFGASDIGVAVLMSALYAVFLAGLLASCAWARRDCARLREWKAPATLFVALLIAVLWPLTPWGPGGAHPVWTYLPGDRGSLTVDRSALALSVVQLAGLACLVVSGRIIGVSTARGRWFLRLLVFGLGVYAAAAFIDQVAVRRDARLSATLLSPNSAATLFGAGVVLAAALSIHRLRRGTVRQFLTRGDIQTTLTFGVLGVVGVTLLLTASRGGFVATGTALTLFLIWEAFSRRRGVKATGILGGIVLVLILAGFVLRSVGGVAERFGEAQHDVSARTAIFAAHFEAFRAAPWFGFGLGSFPSVNQLIVTQQNLPALFNVRATHNLYLQWLEEGGIVGALAMTALFAGLVWPILRAAFRDEVVGLWCRATLCAAMLVLLHGLTDFAVQVPALQAVAALVLGVVGGMASGRAVARTPVPAAAGRSRVVTGLACLVAALALSAAAPLLAGRFGLDLSDWPTAPADALATTIESGLGAPAATGGGLGRLDRLSRRELSLRPASGAAWLRRAAVDDALDRDVAANQALERSFAVAPLQTSLFVRRTLFSYDRWDRLSPAARERAIYQLGVEWRRRRFAPPFVALANQVRNPAGRVGLALEVATLRLEAR